MLLLSCGSGFVPSKEEHAHKAEQWHDQVLVGKIIDYCVCGKNGQEKLKEH